MSNTNLPLAPLPPFSPPGTHAEPPRASVALRPTVERDELTPERTALTCKSRPGHQCIRKGLTAVTGTVVQLRPLRLCTSLKPALLPCLDTLRAL